MKTIVLQKSAPVAGNYDVVVCGGGPAGLIAAGRCIAAEKEPYASIRVQATAMSIGEAAGIMADMHCIDNAPVYNLPIKQLSERIDERGLVL